MKLTDNKLKQASLDLAEDSREIDWKYPSFVAELFKGNFVWDLLHPFPAQNKEDKAIGDEFIEKLEKVLLENINADEVDKTGQLPPKAIKALAEIGCFGMKIPKEYGGLGFSVVNYNRAMAVLGSYCGSTTVWLSAHQSIGVPQPLKLFGTQEQKESFLPRLAKGAVSAFALTEPDVGSDPANMTTTATLSEDGTYYELTGKKVWITNGPAAEILIVMAQTKPMIVHGKEKKQISAFIVETSTPGFEVVHHCEFMGIRGISNGLLRFNQMKIPAKNRIGEEGQGLKIALATLNTGRLTVPAAVTGMAKLCMRYNRDWTRKRIQWGQPIGKHQAIEQKNAFIATNTLAMESITWLTSAFADKHNKDIRLEAAMAKYFCTERAWSIVDETLQIKGGRGYETAPSLRGRGEKPDPIERMLRDTRINRIIEGTSEIMHLFIAREAMDMHVRYIMPIMDTRNSMGKRVKAFGKAFFFYSWWYPKQFIRLPKGYQTQALSSENQRHLRFIAKASKRLARKLFETMGKYQQKLEREQLLLAEFVNIGTDLFAMSATLSYTDHLLSINSKDTTSQELANLFCLQAKDRILACFQRVSRNHNKLVSRVGRLCFDEKLKWQEEGIMHE